MDQVLKELIRGMYKDIKCSEEKIFTEDTDLVFDEDNDDDEGIN